MGGKSGSGNDQMVQLQMQQAEEARAKEAARQGRLTQGLAGIRQAFEGAPVMKNVSKKFDWSKAVTPTGMTAPNVNLATILNGKAFGMNPDLQVSGLPTGYKYVHIAATPGTITGATGPTGTTAGGTPHGASAASGGYVGGKDAVQPNAAQYGQATGGGGGGYYGSHGGHGGAGVYSASSNSGGGYQQNPVATTATTGGTPDTWGIVGPDGKIYKQGEDITFSGQEDTGKRSGGFGEQDYKDYSQKFQNIYMPQVAKQYSKALEDTTYNLARAGTSLSSAATGAQADLAGQNTENRANVISEADKAAADWKSRIASERAKAEGQLYATENPDVATNQALAAVRNISLDQPKQSTLGDVFKLALIGGANALQGYRTQQSLNSIPGYNAPGTKIYGA